MENEIIRFRNTGSKKAEMKEQSIVYKSITITFLKRLKGDSFVSPKKLLHLQGGM